LIFCAPPEASVTLRRAGISVVSTANNHAFDYGLKGLRETIQFLNRDNIRFTGTVADSGAEFKPVIIERDSLKIGIIAYTQTVNMIRGKRSGLISVFDSSRAKCEIDSLKPAVDFVLVSYHGGDEYKDIPGESAGQQMELLAEFGADMVIGHHSHVPQGIRMYKDCLIFNSLGNAVFKQPQRYWTQKSFAVLIGFAGRNGKKEISSIELIPFRPGYQLQTDLNSEETVELMDRIQKLSTVTITKSERGYFVILPAK
jgi:poly-gamma-glutamate synthesis protein (capsule biosynthesis protein)